VWQDALLKWQGTIDIYSVVVKERRMDRRQFLAGAMALGGLTAFGTASKGSSMGWDYALHYNHGETDPDEQGQPDALQTVKLTDSLSVIMGAGGNIGVLKAATGGAIQIDSGLTPRSADIAKAVVDAAGSPTSMLINTHWHFDHTGGNEALGKAQATIIAHEATRKRLSSDQFIEFMKMKSPAAPAIALPVATFTDRFTLYSGDEQVELVHVAPAHTDSDIYLHFKKANVIHAGDLMFNGFYPFIDYSTKGWIGGMVAGADAILKAANADTKIIPGHGPVASRADLVAFRNMLHEVHTRLEKQLAAGKKVPQIVAAKPLKDLDAKWAGGFMKGDAFVACAAESIVRRRSA